MFRFVTTKLRALVAPQEAQALRDIIHSRDLELMAVTKLLELEKAKGCSGGCTFTLPSHLTPNLYQAYAQEGISVEQAKALHLKLRIWSAQNNGK